MKHKHKPKGSVFAALDIGSSKIACFIARVVDDEGHFEVLGIGHQASSGIKAGTIVDIDAAEAAIRRTVHAAENMASSVMKGYPLREVIINIPGVHAQSNHVQVDVDVHGEDITDNDVRRALYQAQEQDGHKENELIHTIPASYCIDGHNGIKEPRGMYGQGLTVEVHLVTGETSALRNMVSCVERSHLDITAMCASSYAAGLASLVEDEMDLGCTVIDMGGGVTSFSVFHGSSMVYADAVPIGGQHVTSDIARGLTTTMQDAERLKTLYGSAVATGMDENELIDVPQVGEDDMPHPNHVPRSLLVGIIQPRLQETLELVQARLHDSGATGVAGRRVVLTGGASQIPGLRDLAQTILEKQVRLGRPIRIGGLPDAVSGPAFATTAGLLTYISECSDEIPAEIMAQAIPNDLWGRMKYWLRENW